MKLLRVVVEPEMYFCENHINMKPVKEKRVRLLVGFPGASTTPIYSPGSSSTPIYSPGSSSTPIYSPGSSSTPIYSPGSSTPPRYFTGASTPPSYSLGTSRNAECSNGKHLLDKITKFNLEANAEINFSFKLSSFDFAVNITDDAEYTQQSGVEKGNIFDNKEALILAVRLKALNEDSYVPNLSTPDAYDRCCAFKGSIQGNKSGSCGHGWKQSDCANCIWHHAIAIAVKNEFPLAFHDMSTSSNTTFEFGVNHNGEFKLNPLAYQHGSLLNIHVLQMDFEDIVSYLKWKIPRQFNTLYYMLPPNYTLSGMKQIKNDYETNVMYDIAKVAGKLQIFVSHTPIDLSMVLILNNGSLAESLAGIISKETKIKLEESLNYLHQMQKRKNEKFNYYELLVELGFIKKTKPNTPYTQTFFNFVVHNSGQLVLDDTNNTMYVNGETFNINIPRLKLAYLKQYVFNILGTNIHALYYKIPHNGFSLTVKLRNNYDTHVTFDISSAYIDYIGVNSVISKYIFPNASLAEMMNHVINDYSSENEGIIRQETQNDYTFDKMVEWVEQEHFEYEVTNISCPKIDLSSVLIQNNSSKEESFQKNKKGNDKNHLAICIKRSNENIKTSSTSTFKESYVLIFM
nr:oligopeptide transporter [Tanacetum cinerariifolium]